MPSLNTVLVLLAIVVAADCAVTHSNLQEGVGKELIKADSAAARLGGSFLKRWNDGTIYLAERAHLVEKGSQDPNEGPTFTSFIVSCIVTAILWIPFGVLGALLFKMLKVDRPAKKEECKDEDLTKWSSEWYECHQNIPDCIWACCCPCVIWADNMYLLGEMRFWVGFALFLTVMVINTAAGGVFMWCLLTILFTYYRGKIRDRFGMPKETLDTAKDCGLWCCCSVCAIAQEARHITRAIEKGEVAIPEAHV